MKAVAAIDAIVFSEWASQQQKDEATCETVYNYLPICEHARRKKTEWMIRSAALVLTEWVCFALICYYVIMVKCVANGVLSIAKFERTEVGGGVSRDFFSFLKDAVACCHENKPSRTVTWA